MNLTRRQIAYLEYFGLEIDVQKLNSFDYVCWVDEHEKVFLKDKENAKLKGITRHDAYTNYLVHITKLHLEQEGEK